MYMRNRSGVVFPIDYGLLENPLLGFSKCDIDGVNADTGLGNLSQVTNEADLLNGNVEAVTKGLALIEDLEALSDAEKTTKNRVSVLNAIADERLRRSQP